MMLSLYFFCQYTVIDPLIQVLCKIFSPTVKIVLDITVFSVYQLDSILFSIVCE